MLINESNSQNSNACAEQQTCRQATAIVVIFALLAALIHFSS